MASTPSIDGQNGAVPPAIADAVLVQSTEMPTGSQKVEELDFNKFAGRTITVDDLLSGMNNMGFQASSSGEAVRIINDMASLLPFLASISNRFPAVLAFL
jgi:deoxyhypusine synthase